MQIRPYSLLPERGPVTTQAGPRGIVRPAARLWTPAFVVLCVTVLLGYAHHALLVPTIPLYITDQGGSKALAGLALMTFSIPSFGLRPIVGKLSDSWSAAGVLTIGLALLALGGVVYMLPFLAAVFVAGGIRGLGWAGNNTGGYTILANTTVAARRGEASGYYSSITTSATVLFPALALWLIDTPGGFESVFLASAGIAAAGVALSYFILRPMTRVEPTDRAAAAAAGASTGMFDRGVLLATVLNLCSSLASPFVAAFLPLYARDIGIGHIGLFYVFAGITSIVIRPLLGKQSDTLGRGPSIAIGFLSLAIGLALIIVAQNLPMILLGGVFTSLGSALNSSSTTALAMDLANPAARGKAMATFSLSFQVGAGFGAIIAGLLADFLGYRGMYAGALVIVTLGTAVLLSSWKSLPRTEPAT